MKVFCILSDHRALKSLSPVMHTAVLKKNGMPGVYVPFAVGPGRLEDAIKGIWALGITGANVTVPYKEAVMPFLTDLSPEAGEIGAVNTLVREGDGFMGHNTDAAGFAEALRRTGKTARGMKATLVGTGGAARAVLYALNTLDVSRITLVGRNASKTHSLAKLAGAEVCSPADLPERTRDVDLIINASSVSSPTESRELAELTASIRPGRISLVADLNYGRPDNFWRSLAQRTGAVFMDGLPMLAAQAARSFCLWTGVNATVEDFMEALEASK